MKEYAGVLFLVVIGVVLIVLTLTALLFIYSVNGLLVLAGSEMSLPYTWSAVWYSVLFLSSIGGISWVSGSK